jgi:hypothetical protein
MPPRSAIFLNPADADRSTQAVWNPCSAVCKNDGAIMTADGFRRIAVGMKDVLEGAHMGHPDFRVNGKIFATIHPDHAYGMVKLTPEQQQHFVRVHPATFAPENGAWGRAGCTRVRLDWVDEETLGEAMTLAWQSIGRAGTAKGSKPSRARSPESALRARKRKSG